MDVIVGVSFVFVTSMRKSFVSSKTPSEAFTLMSTTPTSAFKGVPAKIPSLNVTHSGASIKS